MSSSRQQTIRDLLRTTLPMGTQIVAGRAGLNRLVTWVSVLQTRPPAFPSLEGHELALLSIDALRLLNDKLSLADIIADLAHLDVAAVGVVGEIDHGARVAADEYGIPLLKLPDSTPLRHVEREVVKGMAGPAPSSEQRGLEIHQQLLQLSTANRGMAALVSALVDATGKTVVVQDKRFETLIANGPLKKDEHWPGIESALAIEDALPVVFRNRDEVAQVTPDPALIELPEFGVRRLVVPIVANHRGRGFFSMLTAGDDFDTLDMQFVRHGAAVMALEMAKEKAIREAQKRVQGGILERLLTGQIPTDQARRQLARLGHRPEDHPYAAITAAWAQDSGPSDRRLETLFNEQVSVQSCEAVVQLIEGGVVIFCADDAASPKAVPRTVRQLADSVLARIHMQFPNANVIVGIGRAVHNLAEWRRSYQEATAAQRIAGQWHVFQPLFFGDLGVYRLLSLLLESQELRSFYRETLGDLADERYANDEFITTLETFFEEHGNLSQTASKLHVHRNTLLYRMDRIAQIGGFDLDNPETRLAVNLALKIRRLTMSPGTNSRPG